MAFIVNPSDDNDTLHGDHGADALVTASLLSGAGSQGAQGATLVNFATITGTPFDDVLNGDGSANTIFGLGGNDTINAGGGADVVNGGSGDDHIIDDDIVGFDTYDGGSGLDTIDYSNVKLADGVVTINLELGETIVSGANGQTLTDTFVNIENVIGTQNGDFIVGDANNN